MTKAEKRVKWRRTVFGMMANFDVPQDCSVVVVCVNGGKHGQLHPVDVLLPHQIYYKDCQRWLKENEATEITLIQVMPPFTMRPSGGANDEAR